MFCQRGKCTCYWRVPSPDNKSTSASPVRPHTTAPVARFQALALASCLAVGAPSTTFAEKARSAAPTPAQIAEARTKFRRAEVIRLEGDFARAATSYLEAYAVMPDPELLYNAGQMFLMAGDLENARRYLEQYLASDPGGRGHADAQRWLEGLPPPTPLEPAAGSRPAGAHAAIAAPAPVSDPTAGRSLRIAGLATAGAGLAALGVGVAYGVRAHELGEETADWDVFDRDRHAAGRRAETRMMVFTSAGAAALVTGGILYVLGRRGGADTAERPVVAAPLATGELTGIALEGAF